MHLPTSKGFRMFALTSLVTMLVCLPAQAVLPILFTGEDLVYSDDFNDNANGWSNVSVINGSGTATTGTASIGGGTWTPSVPGNGAAVTSSYTFSQALDVFSAPIALYMRVRLDNANADPDASLFSIQLGESTGDRFFKLTIRDNAPSRIEYRNASGDVAFTELYAADNPTNAMFFDMKVILTPGADVNQLASVEAYGYDPQSFLYLGLGGASNVVDLNSGIFDTLTISSSNGTNGAVFFDSVAVTGTVIPEPSTFAALTGALVLLGATVRRRRDRSVS